MWGIRRRVLFKFLAQGDLVTLGALLTYSLTVTQNWSVLEAVVPIVLAVGLVGLVQPAALRSLRSQPLGGSLLCLGDHNLGRLRSS